MHKLIIIKRVGSLKCLSEAPCVVASSFFGGSDVQPDPEVAEMDGVNYGWVARSIRSIWSIYALGCKFPLKVKALLGNYWRMEGVDPEDSVCLAPDG